MLKIQQTGNIVAGIRKVESNFGYSPPASSLSR
jgi:hypothetical protein